MKKTHLEIGCSERLSTLEQCRWRKVENTSKKFESLTWVNLSSTAMTTIVNQPWESLFPLQALFLLQFQTFLFHFRFGVNDLFQDGREREAKVSKIWIYSFFLCSHPEFEHRSRVQWTHRTQAERNGGKIDVLNLHMHESLRNCAINFKTLMHHN